MNLLKLIAYWLEGIGVGKTARELKIWDGTVSSMWAKLRIPVAWHQQNLPKTLNEDCIADITWGPHRRRIRYGVPARPLKYESYTFQVVIAFCVRQGVRKLVPGSLRVQRVCSKEASYNKNILLTMLDPSCSIVTDQGSEWVRLPHFFARAQTVNHSVEWVTADGVTTNLGEAFNGILKKMGTELSMWKGRIASLPVMDVYNAWAGIISPSVPNKLFSGVSPLEANAAAKAFYEFKDVVKAAQR